MGLKPLGVFWGPQKRSLTPWIWNPWQPMTFLAPFLKHPTNMPPRRQRFHASFCAWRETRYEKTQATEGVLGGHALSRRALLQSHTYPQLHTVLKPRSVAAASERPGLEAADAALAAAVTELAEVVPDAHACQKKRVWLYGKRLLVPWMLHRLWVPMLLGHWTGQLSRWQASLQLVEMSAGFLVLAARATYGNLYLNSVLKKFCHSTRAFHDKFPWQAAVEVQLVSLLLQGRALSSAFFALRQLALNKFVDGPGDGRHLAAWYNCCCCLCSGSRREAEHALVGCWWVTWTAIPCLWDYPSCTPPTSN